MTGWCGSFWCTSISQARVVEHEWGYTWQTFGNLQNLLALSSNEGEIWSMEVADWQPDGFNCPFLQCQMFQDHCYCEIHIFILYFIIWHCNLTMCENVNFHGVWIIIQPRPGFHYLRRLGVPGLVVVGCRRNVICMGIWFLHNLFETFLRISIPGSFHSGAKQIRFSSEAVPFPVKHRGFLADLKVGSGGGCPQETKSLNLLGWLAVRLPWYTW